MVTNNFVYVNDIYKLVTIFVILHNREKGPAEGEKAVDIRRFLCYHSKAALKGDDVSRPGTLRAAPGRASPKGRN